MTKDKNPLSTFENEVGKEVGRNCDAETCNDKVLEGSDESYASTSANHNILSRNCDRIRSIVVNAF